ncbi:hypothetical protein [Flavobacterium succinicans]|uniref:Lipoprotein n=1 Tax=Flavobacterium succinicans TaxID=29536 RepID=A0A199XTI5_9FLAO|nr:hypothetical protein [Flavobacterium succinicans]OAZ05068.1 hypothetical protein FLB_09190 [Flavobacterium succinicans]
MKNSLRFLFVSVFLVLLSCSKNDDEPTITTTYKLTMKATVPTEGNTVFSTITYKKADGTTATINNTSTSFLESFTISSGFNVLFNVSGTNKSTSQPNISINYMIEKYENNVNKGMICYGSSTSVGGSSGSWTFNSNNSTTFNGTSCQ